MKSSNKFRLLYIILGAVLIFVFCLPFLEFSWTDGGAPNNSVITYKVCKSEGVRIKRFPKFKIILSKSDCIVYH